MNSMITFGEKLRELRELKGWTQSQVAEAVHVSAQTYSRWELDQRQPSYDVLADLLYVLNNAELRIHNKEVRIENDVLKPNRTYLEIPAYEEVVEQYEEIETLIKEVLTMEDVYEFAKAHPQIEIEVNGDSLEEWDENEDSEIDWVRFGYKNLHVYKVPNHQTNQLEMDDPFTLYSDMGCQFNNRNYLNPTEYFAEIFLYQPENYTLNPAFKRKH